MKIAHISDIHFRGSQRHEEYKIVCKQLFESLKVKKPDLVVCTGDIFHTKTSGITPEVIDLLSWFFKEIAAKHKLLMILGNHDGNLTNLSRQDSISPIVDAIAHPNITLLKQSKPFWFNDDILFHAFSCFDKEHWSELEEQLQKVEKETTTTIALFHGSVLGCVMDNGMVTEHGEVDLNFFKNYDIALLGDIHKRQGFKTNKKGMPTIAYPGSLIQQNFGEEIEKGYLLWEINDKEVEFVEFISLFNPFPFVSVEWKKSIENLVNDILKIGNIRYLNGVRVRVLFEPGSLSTNEKRAINNTLCEKYGVEGPVTFKPIGTKQNSLAIEKPALEEEQQKLVLNQDAFSSLNVKDPEVILDLFKKTNKKTFKDEDLKKFINECMIEAGIEQSSAKTNSSWRLKEIHFENLFRFGEDNKINFDRISGITGIFGPNKIGKSSIIGTLMFGLFNATDRGPARTSHIINKNATKGVCSMIITVDGVDYFIERTATKLKGKGGIIDEEKAVTNLNIFKLVDGKATENIVGQTEDTKIDTDRLLRNLIGTADDFLLTALSSQGNINAFIDKGSTERKAVLNRFLGFDVFEKMFKPACEKKNIVLAKINKRTTELIKEKVKQEEEKMAFFTSKEEEERKKLKDLFSKQKDCNTWLSLNRRFIEEKQQQKIFFSSVQDKKQNIEAKTKQLQILVANLERVQKDLQEEKEKIKTFPSDHELQHHIEKLANIEKNIAKLQANIKVVSATEATQIKNIKKLELVPCGDSFPTCHFIKDAHEDQKSIIGTKATLLSLTDELNNLYSLQKTLIEYGHIAIKSEKLATEKKLNSLTLEEHDTILKIDKTKQEISSLNEMLKWHEQEYEKFSVKNFDEIEKTFNEKQKELFLLENEIAKSSKEIATLAFGKGTTAFKIESSKEELQELIALEQECAIAEAMSTAFSKTGIPGMILSEQLPKINSELEKISSEVSDFRLSLLPDNKSNALNIVIDDSNGSRLIDLGSGAEKMIASLALRIALYNLSILPKPDMCIIDESFGVLDDVNRPKLISLLQSFKSMFRNVLIISHIQDVKEAADNLLEIEANETTSRIYLE